jgi:hypothetical protein
MPCRRCGGEKPPGVGRLYCDACKEQELPVWQRARNRPQRPPGIKLKVAPVGMRWCPRCVDYLPLGAFSLRGRKPAAYCSICTSELGHSRNLAKSFGLTVADYEALMVLQEDRCAICLTRPVRLRLAVDHSHATGEIRGLLCKRCNHKLLGAALDRAWVLRRAAAYLDDPPARTQLPLENLGEAA